MIPEELKGHALQENLVLMSATMDEQPALIVASIDNITARDDAQYCHITDLLNLDEMFNVNNIEDGSLVTNNKFSDVNEDFNLLSDWNKNANPNAAEIACDPHNDLTEMNYIRVDDNISDDLSGTSITTPHEGYNEAEVIDSNLGMIDLETSEIPKTAAIENGELDNATDRLNIAEEEQKIANIVESCLVANNWDENAKITEEVNRSSLVIFYDEAPSISTDAVHAREIISDLEAEELEIVEPNEVEVIDKNKANASTILKTEGGDIWPCPNSHDLLQEQEGEVNADCNSMTSESATLNHLKVDTFAKRLNYLNSVDKLNSPKKIVELINDVGSGKIMDDVVDPTKDSTTIGPSTVVKENLIPKESVLQKACTIIETTKAAYRLPTHGKAYNLQPSAVATANNTKNSGSSSRIEARVKDAKNDNSESRELNHDEDTTKKKLSFFARLFGRREKLSISPPPPKFVPVCCYRTSSKDTALTVSSGRLTTEDGGFSET